MLPNLLTLLRLLLTPVFIGSFILGFHHTAALLFGIAALSDLLDGYLARRLHMESTLGAFLDPVADKIIVVSALILLVQRDPHLWMVLPTIVIIGREIAVSALREWSAGQGVTTLTAVSWPGKVKTVSQMLALLILIYKDLYQPLGIALLYLATLLTLGSMLHYLYKVWPILLDKTPPDSFPPKQE